MRFIYNFITIRLSHAINESPLQLFEDYQTFLKR
jgi:hypothetical protein